MPVLVFCACGASEVCAAEGGGLVGECGGLGVVEEAGCRWYG